MQENLKALESHFAFGENWAQYATLIDEARINEAKTGLLRLITAEELQGRTMLDIGCGSGLHSLAALQLGVGSVLAVDIDPNSVATTRAVLDLHAAGKSHEVRQQSVFDATPETMGQFDIVYSWGVLHHTGAMQEAVLKAATLVKPGGLFAFALYRKTRLCGPWTVLKRWYAGASDGQQAAAQQVYVSLMRLGFLVTGRDFAAYKQNYKTSRGMDFIHDVHDWMGGYPYESVSEAEVDGWARKLGYQPVRRIVRPYSLGLFGSGCDEYVFRRRG
jgi:SAM-dependent methyltransferase